MTFLELINKCLVELNYKPVNTFSELTKNEHHKIINILNLLNSEVCQHERWNFLIRRKILTLPSGMREIDNTINGRISQILIDDSNFNYHEHVGEILAGKFTDRNLYTSYDGKLLFTKKFDEPKEVKVIYYTFDNTLDINGMEKDILEFGTDTTLIPKPYQEGVLVYGACMRLKGNPQHIRFNYWLSMYKDALSSMVSKCSIDANFHPQICLKRT